MKIKALLIAAVFAAGAAASLALAKEPKPPKHGVTTGTTATTSTTVTAAITAPKRKCNHVSLNGAATTGSITLTVKHADRRHHALVNTPVTLTVPAGARLEATACDSAGTLTVRNLELEVKKSH